MRRRALGDDDDDNSGGGDDWEEIDKLMRELEETQPAVNQPDTSSSSSLSTSSTSSSSQGEASGEESDEMGIWDSIDSLIRSDEQQQQQATTTAANAQGAGVESEASVERREVESGSVRGGGGGGGERKKDLQKMTVTELKDKLRMLGLPVSGRKAVLIERLQSATSSSIYMGDPSASRHDGPGGMGGSDGAQGLFTNWDDATGEGGKGSFEDWQGSGNFEMMPPLSKPLFGDAELERVPTDPALGALSVHFEDKSALMLEGADYRSEVPANSERMLQGYESLPDGYTWRGDPQEHPKLDGYEVFALSSDVDFLVKSGGLRDDGRLFLDISDVYVYHKPSEIYSIPEKSGIFPSDGLSEYYAYPITQWFPGDALKNRPEVQEVVKIILVQVKSADIRAQDGGEEGTEGRGGEEGGEVEGEIVLLHGEDFELDIEKTFVLDGVKFCVQGMNSAKEQNEVDYQACRSGKSGVLTSTRWNAFSFPKPLMLQFNEGSASEDGIQTFGLCVSEKEGLSLQRWERMQEPSELVNKAKKEKESASSSDMFIEKGSPFEFLGRVTSEEVEREWKELGLGSESNEVSS